MAKAIDILKSSLDPAIIPDEWILERVRNWRNDELEKSDWTVLPDSPVDKTAWMEYRQKLRDLPSSADPSMIELPDRP